MLVRWPLGVCSQSIFMSESGNCNHLWCLKLWFGRPGASILAPLEVILASWGHPGRPWEQQEGHVGIQGRIFIDFGMILGPHFELFEDRGLEIWCCFRVRFHVPFDTDFLV